MICFGRMNHMMKNNKIKDERTIQLNNKIQSEAFLTVITLLALSIFIKSYILHMDVRSYITELAAIIISLIYLVIRGAMIGYSDSYHFGKNFKLAASFLLSVMITIFNCIRNYTLYREHYTRILDPNFIAVIAVTFISSFIFIELILGIVSYIEKIGKKRLEKQLDEEE